MDPLYALFGLGLVGFAVYMLYQMRNKGPVDTSDKVSAVANDQEISVVPVLPILRAKQLNHQADEAEARRRVNESLIGLEGQKAQAMTIKETAELTHQLNLELLKHKRDLLDLAKAMNLTPEACDEYFKKLALDEAQRLHEYKQSITNIELGIIVDRLINHQEAALIQQRLDALYREIALLEQSNEPGKDYMIKDRRDSVKSLEKQKREKEGLLSSNNGKNKGRGLPPPQAPGNLRPQLGANPQP